ncbi:MAG: SH3 domain-containing protein, partial [Clostridia bacterium]|nr:SH3 domain-containing protein [Clostridia bacterium]
CHVHYEPSFLPELGESLTYQAKEGQVLVSFALFGEEVPEEVLSILAATGKTWLTERESLCGYMENGGFTGAQVLLVTRGKDGQRMLVALTRGYREETWRVTVAGTDCLLQEGLIDIIPGNGFGRYAVRMQPEEGRQIHLFFDVFQEGTVLSGLDILEAQDRRLTRLSRGRWESYSWAYGEREETCRFVGKLPYRCEYLDLRAVLGSLAEQLVAAEDVEAIPPVDSGMCITKGEVHFRQDHSSHSADLGMLRPGVPLEILDMVPGTEAAWYKVQLGPMTGWVSGDYVSVGAPDVEAKTMQVARGRQELTLKNRPGIFSLSAGRLSTEQYVYVLLEKGSEAYVLLPDSGITVPAEMEGTYGWVRTSDLMEGAAPVSLIWEDE